MMPSLRLVLGLLFVALSSVLAADRSAFTTTEFVWHDAVRNRDVPALIYAPSTGTAPFPVILFSHGLGGSRHGYSYLGEYWSSHGYISVHVQHPGSDEVLVRESGGPMQIMKAMKEAMSNPDNLINRPKDISFAIDQVTALNAAAGSWKGKFDLARIGVAGHSFGAYTTMAIAGFSFGKVNFADPRVKAVIPMSTPANATTGSRGAPYSTVHIPALHFTGTEDTSMIRPQDTAEFRRKPYDLSPGPDTYLVIFKGADHAVFAGPRQRLRSRNGSNDEVIKQLVCEGSTQFWNAYLKGDAVARKWLSDGGFAHALGTSATLEMK